MTLSRAVSLAALIAVVLGLAIGLSHVGHASVAGPCNDRHWKVIVGHTSDRASNAGITTHASKFVQSDCYGAQPDPNGGYWAIASFTSQADAQSFLQNLIAAGYAKAMGFEPVLESS